jgi:hypothetical protein
MRDAHVRLQRRAMLGQSHIAKLTTYASKLREGGDVEVPDFDPLDGGGDARALFLFEKPGPMTAESGRRPGSGFISRDNDDPTAEATFRFMEQAGIPRKLTVIWNVVPWWNGTRKVSPEELARGIACLHDLLELLPSLSVVVLVGRKAGHAKRWLEGKGLPLLASHHPSPLVRAKFRTEGCDSVSVGEAHGNRSRTGALNSARLARDGPLGGFSWSMQGCLSGVIWPAPQSGSTFPRSGRRRPPGSRTGWEIVGAAIHG